MGDVSSIGSRRSENAERAFVDSLEIDKPMAMQFKANEPFSIQPEHNNVAVSVCKKGHNQYSFSWLYTYDKEGHGTCYGARFVDDVAEESGLDISRFDIADGTETLTNISRLEAISLVEFTRDWAEFMAASYYYEMIIEQQGEVKENKGISSLHEQWSGNDEDKPIDVNKLTQDYFKIKKRYEEGVHNINNPARCFKSGEPESIVSTGNHLN